LYIFVKNDPFHNTCNNALNVLEAYILLQTNRVQVIPNKEVILVLKEKR